MTDDFITPRPALTEEDQRVYSETLTRLAHSPCSDILMDALRYKALRRLTPAEYLEFHKRNLAGENFDAMVDKLVVDLGR